MRDRIVYNDIWDETVAVQESEVGNKVEEAGIEEGG